MFIKNYFSILIVFYGFYGHIRCAGRSVKPKTDTGGDEEESTTKTSSSRKRILFKSPGTEDFFELVVNNTAFVDKSMFIRHLLIGTGFRTCLIAQPRGYGKTINLDMLRRFLDIDVDENGEPIHMDESSDRKLFIGGKIKYNGKSKTLKPLKIAEDEQTMQYQGRHPVISVTFRDIDGNSYQDIEDGIRRRVNEVLNRYSYLMRNTSDDPLYRHAFNFESDIGKVYLQNSIFALCTLLSDHHGRKKVFIFIDEYDTPIMNAYLKFGNTMEYIRVQKFVSGFLDSCFKDNFRLNRGVITGILPIRNRNLSPPNVNDYTIMDADMSRYFGFSTSETDELTKKASVKLEMRELKNWYFGYSFHGGDVYQPWSVMHCLAAKGKLDQYWTGSREKAFVHLTLSDDEIQEDLQTLVVGKYLQTSFRDDINFKLIDRRELMIQVLAFCGYLMPLNGKPSDRHRHEAFVPNNEIEYLYKVGITRWICNALNITLENHRALAQLLADNKPEQFESDFRKAVSAANNFNDTNQRRVELFYRGFMISLTQALADHYVNSNTEYTAFENSMMILIPMDKNCDTVIYSNYKIVRYADELQSAVKAALNEIDKGKQDDRTKRPSLQKVLKLSMAFYRKESAFLYKIDNINA